MFGTFVKREKGELEAVVAAYERQLLVHVTRITGNASIAEDVVQETFIKLAGQWRGPMEPGPPISAWLYKVAHNGAIDALRRERRRGELHRAQAEEIDETVPPSEGQGRNPLPLEAQRVRDALGALSERERALIVGRDPDCDLRVFAYGVSRRHCAIWRDAAGTCWLLDLAVKKFTCSAKFQKSR